MGIYSLVDLNSAMARYADKEELYLWHCFDSFL